MDFETQKRWLTDILPEIEAIDSIVAVGLVAGRLRAVLTVITGDAEHHLIESLDHHLDSFKEHAMKRGPSLLFGTRNDPAGKFIKESRAVMRSTLSRALFDLDVARVRQLEAARLLVFPVAAAPEPSTRDRLSTMLMDVVATVEASDLSYSEKEHTRAILYGAMDLVKGDLSAAEIAERLRTVLGQAVAKASRPGSSKIWSRVIEAIIVTEAAFSLGSIVYGMIDTPDAVKVEVTCVVPQAAPLALPAGPSDPAEFGQAHSHVDHA